MDLDFTFSKFRKLCDTISQSGYEILTIRKYLNSGDKPKRFIIIRHDIDEDIALGLKMAEIEKEYDICSTYYIRMVNNVFNPNLIKRIAGMGHEIGYHYEVMDKAKGDKKKAIEIFKKELAMLREVCSVDTICMHGNPRTPWDNKSIWNDHSFEDYDIIGEAYLSINFNGILYLSDTGRNWGNKFKIKDVPNNLYGKDILEKISTTDDVIELLKQNGVNHIYLSSHPWWTDSHGVWLKDLIWQHIKNVVKAILVKRAYYGKNKEYSKTF